jgi:hypothetical protein
MWQTQGICLSRPSCCLLARLACPLFSRSLFSLSLSIYIYIPLSLSNTRTHFTQAALARKNSHYFFVSALYIGAAILATCLGLYFSNLKVTRRVHSLPFRLQGKEVISVFLCVCMLRTCFVRVLCAECVCVCVACVCALCACAFQV